MWYLRDFPANIRPALEAIVIKADRGHRLTGHLGGRSALAAVRVYVVQVYCDLGAELCRAVEARDFAYLDLSPALYQLQHALVRDAYRRSDLSHWADYGEPWSFRDSLSLEGFEKQVTQALETSPEWQSVQTKRIELALTAEPAPQTAPANVAANSPAAVALVIAQGNPPPAAQTEPFNTPTTATPPDVTAMPPNDPDPEVAGPDLEVGEVARPEVARRRQIFDDYVTATNVDNIRAICRGVGIESGGFYDWKNGTLLRQSKTSKKIERFLIAKRPPPEPQ